MEWQPIETAPKVKRNKYDSAPIVLLASDRGHRALGYWGKGIRNTSETWISIHDHAPIEYWNSLTHWMLAPDCPEPPK